MISGIIRKWYDSSRYIMENFVVPKQESLQIYQKEQMSVKEKLKILSDAAKYDVSCSSSGVGRKGD